MTSLSLVPLGNVAMTVPGSYPGSSSSFVVVVFGFGEVAGGGASLSVREGVICGFVVMRAARGKGTPMTTTYAAMKAEISQPAPNGARGDATTS